MSIQRDERRRRVSALLRRAVAIGFGFAMVAAPFLALLLNWSAGLAVMAIALGATVWLLLDARKNAELDAARQRLVAVIAGVNALLALICLIVLIVFHPV